MGGHHREESRVIFKLNRKIEHGLSSHWNSQTVMYCLLGNMFQRSFWHNRSFSVHSHYILRWCKWSGFPDCNVCHEGMDVLLGNINELYWILYLGHNHMKYKHKVSACLFSKWKFSKDKNHKKIIHWRYICYIQRPEGGE